MTSLSRARRLLLAALVLAALAPIMAQADAPLSGTRPLSLSDQHGWAPSIAVDPSGVVHVFWSGRGALEEGTPQALVHTSNQSGEWSAPVEIMLSPGGASAIAPVSTVDREGRIHLFWRGLEPNSRFGSLYHSWAPIAEAHSARGWRPAEWLAGEVYGVDASLGPDGTLHVVYGSVGDGAGVCHVPLDSRDDSWGDRTCIPHPHTLRDGESEVLPRLAVDHRGYLHVVWAVQDYSPLVRTRYYGRGIHYARSTDGGVTWAAMKTIEEIDSRDSNADLDPGSPCIAVDTQDRIHVVWISSRDMYRYHQWSADGGMTWTEPEVAAPVGGYNHTMALVLDGSGTLHLVTASLYGLVHTSWTVSGWSPYALAPGSAGAHHAQAVVSLGNELHAVWMGGGGMPPAYAPQPILHATSRLAGPTFAPEVVPTLAPRYIATVSRLVLATPTPTPEGPRYVQAADLAQGLPAHREVHGYSPLLVGGLASLVLVFAVLGTRGRGPA